MMVSHTHDDAGGAAGGGRVTRRTIAKGSAWAAPLLVAAVPAPAIAASEACVGGTARRLGEGTKPTTLTFAKSPVTALVGIVATKANGTAVTPLPGGGDAGIETGEVVDGEIAMVFDEPDDQMGMTLTMTITMSHLVTGLQLTITDIDQIPGLWIDWVTLEPSGFTIPTKGSYVMGDGTAPTGTLTDSTKGPFRSDYRHDIADSDINGHVTVRWPTPVQEVKVHYRPADAVGDSREGQHIRIAKIGFDSC